MFDEKVKTYFREDLSKYLVASSIVFKTNYQEEDFEGLAKGESYFSYTVLQEEVGIKDRKKISKLLKELETDNFFTWVVKSKSRGEKSKIRLNLISEVTQKQAQKLPEAVEEEKPKKVSRKERTTLKGREEVFKEMVEEFTQHEDLKNMLFEFIGNRIDKETPRRKFTERALKSILKKLKDGCFNEVRMLECLSYALEKNYDSVFPKEWHLTPPEAKKVYNNNGVNVATGTPRERIFTEEWEADESIPF